ncbi:long-chain fatty acid--CoA ligase, partial [Alistipes indistinctus]
MTADNLNNMRVIPDLLAINEKVRPNKVAYRQFDDKSKTWISVTWKEFADMVRSWRKAFTASGLSKGDHAAVLLPNSITATACDLSILSQGMVPVPLHAVDTPSSSAFILNNSEAKILFVPRTLRWNAMLNAQKEYPYLKLVVTTGNDAEGASEDSPVPVVNLSDWLKQGENTDLKEVSIDPDDLAAIVYTSGTTGKPKGVMLTHDNVLSNVKSFSQVIDVGSDDVFLSFLPFSHTFERTVTFYFTLFLGAEVGFARSVLKLAEDLKIIRPTIFVAVPRVFEQFHSRIKASLQSKGSIAATLADQAEMIGWRRFCRRNGLAVPSSSASWLDSFIWPMLESRIVLPIRDVFGGRLRIAIAGGAALNNAIGRFYNAMGVELRQGYGLTETSPVISVNRENCNNPVTVGQPIPGLQIRLGDIEELQVKGPTVMKGYWKRPDATAEVFTEDGWFRTGDQADLSDAGRIRIKGRIKEIIVTSTGEKIPPTDMELAIQTDPLFEQVMVVGEARPFITALAVVNEAEWEKFAKEFNVDPSDDRMLMRRDIRMAALKRLKKAASRFPQYGIPRNIRLLKEHWT